MPNLRGLRTLILFILPHAAKRRSASLRETVPDRNTKCKIGTVGRQQSHRALSHQMKGRGNAALSEN
jgi:hypothetical protein